MAQVLLLLVVALTVGAVVFGVMVLVSGGDPGMAGVEPDGRGRPLPGSRPLVEQDVAKVTFDVALRGYRMDQVDRALKRVAYDIGYKDELINVLSAEVEALRDGRAEDADSLRAARLAASSEPEPDSAIELLDATVTESGPPVNEPGLIDLDKPAKTGAAEPAEIKATQPEIDFDEVPDGPFAPWPAASDEKAEASTTEPAVAVEEAKDETDHPTDTPAVSDTSADGSAEDSAEKRADSDADDGDRVVTRG